MQVLYAADPTRNFSRFLVSAFNRVDIDGRSSCNILALNILELENSFVFMIQTRLVQNSDTKVFLLAIRLWHLQEGINFSDSWDVVWDEWLDLCVELDLLRLVALNVLKHFLELLRHGKVCILVGIVSAWNFLLIFIVIFVILTCARLHLRVHVIL